MGGSVERLRGGFPATIDTKGRLKLPTQLREQLKAVDREVYLCSFFPHELRVYPLSVWHRVEDELHKMPQLMPEVVAMIERVNYGQQQRMDEQGRILIPTLLREIVPAEEEVVVSGHMDHISVTRRSRAEKVLAEGTLDHAALTTISQLKL